MLVCFGSPLLDMVAKVPSTFLQKHNLKENDTIAADKEEHKRVFNNLNAYHVEFHAGGSVTNTVRVLQKLLIGEVPPLVTYIGAIGRDTNGQWIKNKLRLEGVDFKFVELDEATTGKCAVLLTGNNRTLVTDLGASRFFSVGDLDENIWAVLIRSSFLYISNFFIKVSIDTVKVVVNHFLNENKKILINLGATFLIKNYSDSVLKLYQSADVVFGNESEFVALAEILNLNIPEKNLRDALENINNFHQTKPERILIVTRGAKSVFMVANQEIFEFEVKFIPREDIVDTNGAGDAFVAGFLSKYLLSHNLSDCVNCGIVTALETVKKIGLHLNKIS